MAAKRRGERRLARGLVHVAELAPPPGAPGPLWRQARVARLREALGPAVGRALLDVEAVSGRLVLHLAGEGWEAALRGVSDELRAKVHAVFGSAAVEIRSHPEREALAAAEAAPRPPQDGEDRERLRRAAARLLARRGEP